MNNIQEHLMEQAETRTINRRTRTVIPVGKMKTPEIMVVFRITSRFTARDVYLRGYYVVDYLKRSEAPGIVENVEDIYRMARYLYSKAAVRGFPWFVEKEDLIQEMVTRYTELAGDPRMKITSFRFNVLKSAMWGYIRRNRRHDHESEDVIDNPILERNGRAGEDCQHCKPSPDTWRRAHAATESMCRVIEAKGITPMERAA